VPFDHRPDQPGAEVLDRARASLAERLSLDVGDLRWIVGERTDRKRSTLFYLTLRSPEKTVATAWYKVAFFPPSEQDSRHLGRAREAMARSEDLGRRLMAQVEGLDVVLNETLAFDETTFEVVTLGLEGEPLGNPLRLLFTGQGRTSAQAACAAVGEAVRIVERLPHPDPAPELDRIWRETERKVESVAPLLPQADRHSLERAVDDLFRAASSEPDPLVLAHGDLSPGNVILMDKGITGVIDFGWIPQLRGFDLSRFVHRLRYTTPSLRRWTDSLTGSVLQGYGDPVAPDHPGWRFSEMQRLLATIQRLERKGEGGRRSAGRALDEIKAVI
jgi:Phosphotransferase enzyme family